MKRAILLLLWCGVFIVPLAASAQMAHRTTVSLNGQWDVEDSVGADDTPKSYSHVVPVPGLTHSAAPAFPDVDQYQTRQLLSALVRYGRFPQADYDKLGDVRGISRQTRNYFWYRKIFHAPDREAVALLKINKAQFGAVVYLNGIRIGEHDPCFTAAIFDVTKAIHWNAPNELVIRIGAHPGVLPADVSQGTDFEKNRWTPGIYDDVSLMAMDNPVIANVQVAPQLATSNILVETELHNYADHAITTTVEHKVVEWRSQASASRRIGTQVVLRAGETTTVRQTVPISKAHLWSPEDPFLYSVTTNTAGDNAATRFGMREFRFDTATQRAYLNGRPYFLRGSNITLHRFFEDPESGTLPWNDAWLHRLLVEIPKKLHWNAFRFCIGPVPDRWLEVADENGLLIENEYMVWTGAPSWGTWQANYNTSEMILEYREWMRDNWNHPSVAIWDATNESVLPKFTTEIIPAVRVLDLSNRPWENSYNAPVGEDDPVEEHQYLLYGLAADRPSYTFQLTDLEWMSGSMPNSDTTKTAHAMILNEYGWTWLNRDGSPTLLTQKLYPRLLGDQNTTQNRIELEAYLLRGETEFWRAYRHYAGVLQFVYLTTSDPQAFTSDHFIDLNNLKLEPHFENAMEQAFNPLGVYLNFWHPSLTTGESRNYTVVMVNGEDRQRTGRLRLVFKDMEGKETASKETAFSLNGFGMKAYLLTLKAPRGPGKYSLRAIAKADDDSKHLTISSRDVTLSDGTATR